MIASRSAPRRALATLPALLVPLVLLLTACGSGGAAPEAEPSPPTSPSLPPATSTAPEPPKPEGSVYVALGDSFVAAPLVPTTNLTHGCLRSDHNYPNLLVRELEGYELVDVSCSGASTAEMTQPQVVGGVQHPPQFDALSDEADLVTIGVGANDFSIFSLLVYQCLNIAATDRDGAPCRDSYEDDGNNRLLDQVEEIQDRVEAVVAEIRERAPEARVVLATYPQLVPDSGVCPDRLPLARGDYAFVREVNLALVEAQVAAAEAGGAEVLDVYTASDGHDICSGRPWVNGIDTDASRALAFHPFVVEQQAVADLLLELLGRG